MVKTYRNGFRLVERFVNIDGMIIFENILCFRVFLFFKYFCIYCLVFMFRWVFYEDGRVGFLFDLRDGEIEG